VDALLSLGVNLLSREGYSQKEEEKGVNLLSREGYSQKEEEKVRL